MDSLEEYAAAGKPVKWPYPIRYDIEREVTVDVLVIGAGVAGCRAAIEARKRGLKVALVEKGNIIGSGAGGAGVDHWVLTANPCSTITPDEMVDSEWRDSGGYTNAISRYISSREGYDTLLETELMGGKIRDADDEYVGSILRDDKTKFMFAYDCVNKLHFAVWGATFKTALKKELDRAGVDIYNRTQATALLTEGGKRGARVIGATGINIRTGEFTVFKAKATVMAISRPQRIWQFSSELTGLATLRPHTCIGNGHAMIWRAGGALTQMEKSLPGMGSYSIFPQYGFGNQANTWFACNMVDADGKEIPYVDRDGRILKTYEDRYRPAPGQKFIGEARTRSYDYQTPRLISDLAERIQKGEYKLPLYADLPGLPDVERRRIWGFMVGNEGKTKISIIKTYEDAGFDSSEHLLQSYVGIGGREAGRGVLRGNQPPLLSQNTTSGGRTFGEGGDAGGIVIDWDLKTTLDGLYAAGDALFAGNYHHHAAVTGRYAGRKAADYAQKADEPVVAREQVDAEKARVYAPIKRNSGLDWKEMNAGTAQIMQNYCGDYRTENLLNIGLLWLKDVEENEIPKLYAPSPHVLGRTIDVMDILTNCQIIIHASLARKASSQYLGFNRIDYPELDPPEWHKWITLWLENGDVKIGDLPIDHAFPLSENYEAHNKDYQGWYDREGKYLTGQAKK